MSPYRRLQFREEEQGRYPHHVGALQYVGNICKGDDIFRCDPASPSRHENEKKRLEKRHTHTLTDRRTERQTGTAKTP